MNDSTIRILHVLDTLEVGGAERVCITQLRLLAGLQRLETGLLILVKGGPLEAEIPRGVARHDLYRRGKYHLADMRRFCVIARQYDVLHLHMRQVLRYVFLAKCLFGFNARIVYQDHASNFQTGLFTSCILRRIARRGKLVAVSRNGIDWFQNKIRAPKEACVLLPNVVIPKRRERGVGLNTGTNRAEGLQLVQVGNFTRTKNHLFSLEVLRSLLEIGTDASLTIYGAVRDRSYFESVMEAVERLDVGSRVRVIHDCMDIQPELPRYDLAINGSLKETGPLVLLEYLAQGLPFVSSREGQVAESVSRLLPELILEHFDPAEWAHRIVSVMDRRPHGLVARMEAAYETEFAPTLYADRCRILYETGPGF